MELIIFLIIIVSIFGSNGKKKKEQQEKAKRALSQFKTEVYTAVEQASREKSGSSSSAFSQVKRQGASAVFPSDDPGRVSAQQARQSHPSQPQKSEYRSASGKNSPLMRKKVTQREKFERSSAYESSNLMDVQYTSNGCGCSTGMGNAASGSAHGHSSAMYDENRFFKESRAICAGKWS